MAAGRRALADRIVPLLTALALPACFDVEQVDPGPFVVDDFEDGMGIASPPFQRWVCFGFGNLNDFDAIARCDLAPGAEGGLALFGEFALQDEQDGVQSFAGGGLRTVATSTIDLTRYSEMTFSARFENGAPPIPGESKHYVELGCASARSAGSVSVSFYVNTSVILDEAWHTFRLALSDFGQPSWESTRIDGGAPACLRLVDSIRLTVSSNLADGEAGHATLFLDDLSFE